jgi:hypothetical protein
MTRQIHDQFAKEYLGLAEKVNWLVWGVWEVWEVWGAEESEGVSVCDRARKVQGF